MKYKPRNTAVVLRLIPRETQKKHGAIFVATNKELYGEAEVMAVGPGNIAAAGGVSETSDLKPGQRVFAKTHQEVQDRTAVNGRGVAVAGIQIEEDGVTYHIFEQMSILLILDEQGEFPKLADLTIN